MSYSTVDKQKDSSEEPLFTKLVVKYEGDDLPIENVQLTIEKRLNEHTLAKIKGRVKQDIFDKFVLTTNSNANLEVEYDIGKKKLLLFNGVIVKIEADSEGIGQNAVFSLEIEALSYTYLLDIGLKRRSFQDVKMTYNRLIGTLLKEYPKSNYLDYVFKGESLNGLTMQYQETDWEFIKRMASRFYAPIIADHTTNFPRFMVGLKPASSVTKLGRMNYKIIKNVDAFRDYHHNYRVTTSESDYIFYEVTTKGTDTKSLEIGDSVELQGQNFRIISVTAQVRHHVLTHTYTLSTSNGFFTPPQFNEVIAGITLQGSVIKVAGNLLKVRLDIDPAQSVENAYWFKYATFYSTWYCMPEIGDRVNVHFPTKDESDALVINSLKHNSSGGFQRQPSQGNGQSNAGQSTGISTAPLGTAMVGSMDNTNKSSKPNFEFESLAENEKVKMIVTSGGKMIILDDQSGNVSLVCNDSTYIKLSDSGDISIVTDSDITFESKADINLLAEEMIYMKAKEKVAFECGESLLEMTPEEIKIKAVDIKMNK